MRIIELRKNLSKESIYAMCSDLNKCNGIEEFDYGSDIDFNLDNWYLSFKLFDYNVMTLGYPSKEDRSRYKTFEHKGIEIGYGKEEWGAEPNKLYFIIKHGKQQ